MDLTFSTRSSATLAERMRITSAGDVGIGTSSPSVKLEVAGAAKLTNGNLSIVPSTATQAAVTICTNTGGSFFAGLDSSTGGTFGVGNYSAVLYNGANTPMVFFTNATERARIDSSGNMGIGTTSPASKLSVVNSSSVQIQASTGTIDFRVQSIDANSAAFSGTVSNHPLAFTTNNSERARIDTSGNLMVGTTSADPIASAVAGISLGSDKIIRAQAVSNPSGIFGRLTTTGDLVRFYYSTSITLVGSISTNGTTTSYNTTSDQRLKENIQDSDAASSNWTTRKGQSCCSTRSRNRSYSST